MKSIHLTTILITALVGASCVEDSPSAPVATQLQSAETPVCAKTENDFIRLRLAKNCVSCHGQGAVAPYFASAEAFEGLLVQNPRLVVPGDPDASELVKLLEGHGTGAFTQMPTAGPLFSEIPEADRDISIEEIRAWITGLQLGAEDVNPYRDAPTTRRVGAAEFRNSLMAQLGLTYEDDFLQSISSNFQSPTAVLKGPVPLRAPDDAPGLHYGAQAASTRQRWAALGGAYWLQRKPTTYEISPSFLQTVTQVSQAWCQLAVNKPDNTAIFNRVSPTDGSDTAEGAIKANIAYLHLRMLGLPATDEDVLQIYNEVFLAHEEAGPKTAWVAVCSYFVRHPLWLSL